MSDETKAACDRIRRVRAGEPLLAVYPENHIAEDGTWNHRWSKAVKRRNADYGTIADAYLAEHLPRRTFTGGALRKFRDPFPGDSFFDNDWLQSEMARLFDLPKTGSASPSDAVTEAGRGEPCEDSE